VKIQNGVSSDESPPQGLVPEELDTTPEEPDTAPEEPEAVSEELPAEGNGEQWTNFQVPAEVGDWPRSSLLPGDTPNDKILQEAPYQGHIASISCSDLSLYENWENMSLKKRTKRANKLRSRGLPVPSERGFI
jgi:hypothetical protein